MIKFINWILLTVMVIVGAHTCGMIAAGAAPVVPVVGTRVKPIRIAVIDTGLAPASRVKLCDNGHIDLSGTGSTSDSLRSQHGTQMAALIAHEAGTIPYCLIIVKVHNGYDMGYHVTNEALKYAAALKPDIVNLSWGGYRFNNEEAVLIRQLLNQGVQIVAASGNNGLDFGKVGCKFYPGCVDLKVHLIAANIPESNFGPQVDATVSGAPLNPGLNSGSSGAAARFSGRLAKQLYESRLKRAPSSRSLKPRAQ